MSLNLLSGLDQPIFLKHPKIHFRHGQYDVEKKTMSVKTILSANYDDETVISRLTQALPNIDLNQVKKEQIGGSF